MSRTAATDGISCFASSRSSARTGRRLAPQQPPWSPKQRLPHTRQRTAEQTRQCGRGFDCGHVSRCYAAVHYHAMSLCDKENSNIIAQIVDSYKVQTVVCRLYGMRCCLLSCLYKATAALWPRDRGAARNSRSLRRSRTAHDHRGVRRGRDGQRLGRARSPAPARSRPRCRQDLLRPGVEARPVIAMSRSLPA